MRYRLLVGVAAICALFPSKTLAISLGEALAFSYENNPTLKAGRAYLESVNEDLPQAYSGFMPSLQGSYSRSREREETTVTSNNEINSPYLASLKLSQPLFNGGHTIYSVKAAKNNIAASQYRLKQLEQEILRESISAYLNVIYAKDALKISEKNKNTYVEYLKATQNRFDLGETTITDVLQSKTRLAQAKSDYSKY